MDLHLLISFGKIYMKIGLEGHHVAEAHLRSIPERKDGYLEEVVSTKD